MGDDTWFQMDTGVRVVDLVATPEGARLYQVAGFRERAFPSMRLLMQQPLVAQGGEIPSGETTRLPAAVPVL